MKKDTAETARSYSKSEKRLNAAWTKSAPPGRHADGGGLFLQVDKSGARRWYLRIVVRGKRRDLGLGSLKYVSLAQAREKALEMRAVARAGGNPKAHQRQQAGRQITFRDLAAEVHERKFKGNAHNGKHIAQWIRTLETYAFPDIGDLPVADVHSDDVERILDPIWDQKPETARRVLQRITTVFDHACGKGYRTHTNPARGLRSLMREQRAKVKHFEALDYGEISTLFEWLSDKRSIGSYALRFTVLTAARSKPVLNARWEQFDEALTIWSVPAENMKTRETFSIPISMPAQRMLTDLREHTGTSAGLVFPSPRDTSKTLCSNAMRKLLQTRFPGATVHGMRASFRTWAAEIAGADHSVAEAALAHGVGNKTVAAYLRTSYFDEREILMEMWAMWAMGELEWFDDRVDIRAEINRRMFEPGS